MTTENNNKLIAEFLGYEWNEIEEVLTQNKFAIQNSVPNFHSDWNWLMEVVEKINLINDFEYSVIIKSMDCYIMNSKGETIASVDCKYNVDELIKSVYEVAIQFIQWHNEQNK
jgi:hypothetical protein